MLLVLYFIGLVSFSEAMVCFHGICDHVPKPELDCKGGSIKNGGFCRCYDVCAKVEDEECSSEIIRGRMSLGTCDTGLTCQHEDHMMIGAGKCCKVTEKSKVTPKTKITPKTKVAPKKEQSRDTTQTLCQQRHNSALISMVVYKGQWIPHCDQDGNFMPMQCDNTGLCFCVDSISGVVDESSKHQLSANRSC